MGRDPFEATVRTYSTRIESLEQENGSIPQSHFRHVARNLLQQVFIPDVSEEARRSLDTYIGLIEKFPAFRRAEMSSENGFFPTPSKDYVSYAAQHLHK
ncbi:MAG: hypothetical protein AABX82_00025 [Nanoarchaeota archaeon]